MGECINNSDDHDWGVYSEGAVKEEGFYNSDNTCTTKTFIEQFSTCKKCGLMRRNKIVLTTDKHYINDHCDI